MSVYTGLKCLMCGKKFTDEDDVVVCPECGTPYHRECYKENGSCINSELHEKHDSFSAAAEHAKNIGTQIKCSQCGADNPPLTLFCEKCGSPIVIGNMSGTSSRAPEEEFNEDVPPFSSPFVINYSDKLCGLNPKEDFDGVSAEELADFVGSNSFFFMPVFKLIKERKRKMTFNLSALIFPTAYYAYRKMFGLMFFSFIIQLLISIPTFIYFVANLMANKNFPVNAMTEFIASIDINGASFALAYNIAVFLNYFIMFLCGTFTNWVYYKFAVMKIKKLKAKKKAIPKNIKKAGGTSPVAMVTVFIVSFAATFLALYSAISL